MTDSLWLTYAWADNDEGDFDYLVQMLQEAGIVTLYDKVSLVPGRRLWAQIADRIYSAPLAGWAYLVTPDSLASPACQEELSYALQRAIEAKGEEFPLIGLLHNVSIRDVPPALRVRLCVSLANPDWLEELRSAVSGVPPHRTIPRREPLIVKIHENYPAQEGVRAIEVRPRFGELAYWRMAFPSAGPQPVKWGAGPANGGGIGGSKFDALEYEDPDIGGVPMRFVGAGNTLTSSTSAYALFTGELPERMFFGVAGHPLGAEATGHVVNIQGRRGA
jgi:hypothetical protein